MYLKFQNDFPGEQPNIAAGGLATIAAPIGPRLGVIYVEAQISCISAGSGVVNAPTLANILSTTAPLLIKIDGREQRSRLAAELIRDNLLQDKNAGGQVSYYQEAGNSTTAPAVTPANLRCVVNNAGHALTGAQLITLSTAQLAQTQVAALIAVSLSVTAVFQIPMYLAEYWRSDLATRENLAWPTSFNNGTVLKPLTIEVPVAAAAATFSGHSVKFWYDYDGIPGVPVKNQPNPLIVKKARRLRQYATAGDIAIPFTQKDLLMQFSVVLHTDDTWSKVTVKKNGTTIKTLTPDRNTLTLQDKGMNTGVVAKNICDVVFDLNDDLAAALPLETNDTFEVILTIANTPAAAHSMILLTESYGFAD